MEKRENVGDAGTILKIFNLVNSHFHFRIVLSCALRKLLADMECEMEMDALTPGVAQHTVRRLWQLGFEPKDIADAFHFPQLFGEEYVRLVVASEPDREQGGRSPYIKALAVLRDELCFGVFEFSNLDTMTVHCKQEDSLLQPALLRLINYSALQSVAYAMTQHYELLLRGRTPDLGSMFLYYVLGGDGAALARSINDHQGFTREFVRFVIELVAEELEHGKQ